MRKTLSILLKTLVKPFYRRYAGPLLLVFILFFGAVGELSGDKPDYTGPFPQLHYQYALILGILTSRIFDLLVLTAWLIYGEKCAQFVLTSFQSPGYRFLQILDNLDRKRSFTVLLIVQSFLYLPVSLYAIAIIAVAVYKGWIGAAFLVAAIILLICLVMAARFELRLRSRPLSPGLQDHLSGGPRIHTLAPGTSTNTPEFLPLKETRALLHKALVRPYYKENAGLFLFIFILLFGVVAPSQQLNYHYHLILGMLNTPALFGLVMLVWYFYSEKCTRFILARLQSPELSFLDILNALPAGKIYRQLSRVYVGLFLPVYGYTLAVLGVAFYLGASGTMLLIALTLALLQGVQVRRILQRLRSPGRQHRIPRRLRFLSGKRRAYGPSSLPYWRIFIRYLVKEQKGLFLGIKLFNGSILYLLLHAQGQTPGDYDLRMPILFYSIGLFGHGVLVYRLRALEETRLVFYRGLPISLPKRMLQYGLLYLVVLIPEMILISWLSPKLLHYVDAIEFVGWSYAVLLLLDSLLFVRPFPMKGYLKLLFCIFMIVYGGVLGGFFLLLTILTFLAATTLFFWSYYRYEA